MFENLEQLIKTIRERKNSSPDKSYTNKLLNDKNLSVSKVKEEIGELIESVEKNSNKIHEAADVIYHLMVYLEANDIKIEDVMSELKKRQKWVMIRIIYLLRYLEEKFLVKKFMKMIMF